MTVPESTSRFCARYPQWRAALTRRSAPRTQTPLSPPRLARGCLCGASMSAWRPTSVLSMPQGNDWSRKTHLMRRSGILCQRHWKSGCEYSPARLHAKHPSQPLLLFTARSVSAHVPPARVFQAHVPEWSETKEQVGDEPDSSSRMLSTHMLLLAPSMESRVSPH